MIDQTFRIDRRPRFERIKTNGAWLSTIINSSRLREDGDGASFTRETIRWY